MLSSMGYPLELLKRTRLRRLCAEELACLPAILKRTLHHVVHHRALSRWDLTIRLGLGHKLFVDSYRGLILSPGICVLILRVGALGSILATEQFYSRVVNIC